ncbi:patatin-like phospholipase family protein [Blastococcus sp. KM273129]|nr:patatin-like phospholipase family protein [Blastococcus sp. KM273129]
MRARRRTRWHGAGTGDHGVGHALRRGRGPRRCDVRPAARLSLRGRPARPARDPRRATAAVVLRPVRPPGGTLVARQPTGGGALVLRATGEPRGPATERLPADPAARRGLVIGAGAALGGAWALGALVALQEVEGYDPAGVEVVVGTSAGSVLAALIGCGVPSQRMVRRLSGGSVEVEGTEPVNALDVDDHVHRAVGDVPFPVLLPGNLALAARALGSPGRHTLMTTAAALAPRGRGSVRPVGELVAEHQGGAGWPDRPRTWVVTMDFDSGRRVVFGRPGSPAAALPEAVMASCAAPGYYPPVAIAGRRYVDGGGVSVTNADVLVRDRLDEVVVLAPMAFAGRDPRRGARARLEGTLRAYATRRLEKEVDRLTAAGSRVRVLAPTPEDLAVIGPDVMDAGRRSAVFETARRTTATVLSTGGADRAEIRPVAS